MLTLKTLLFYLKEYRIPTIKTSDTPILTIQPWTVNNGELLVKNCILPLLDFSRLFICWSVYSSEMNGNEKTFCCN